MLPILCPKISFRFGVKAGDLRTHLLYHRHSRLSERGLVLVHCYTGYHRTCLGHRRITRQVDDGRSLRSGPHECGSEESICSSDRTHGEWRSARISLEEADVNSMETVFLYLHPPHSVKVYQIEQRIRRTKFVACCVTMGEQWFLARAATSCTMITHPAIQQRS